MERQLAASKSTWTCRRVASVRDVLRPRSKGQTGLLTPSSIPSRPRVMQLTARSCFQLPRLPITALFPSATLTRLVAGPTSTAIATADGRHSSVSLGCPHGRSWDRRAGSGSFKKAAGPTMTMELKLLLGHQHLRSLPAIRCRG